MKKLSCSDVVSLIIVVLMFLSSYVFIPYLPETLPTHWNFIGEVDGYMNKYYGVWIFPTLTLLLTVLFHFLPLLDPNREKYRLFMNEWNIIKIVFVVFFSYIYAVSLYIALYPEEKFLPLFFLGFGVFFILLGNYLSKIRQNYFIGIKVPWTLSNEDNWNKTHRYASWLFVGTGILTVFESYFLWYAPIIIFTGIILSTVLPILYSYLLFVKKELFMKYVYGIICIVVLVIATFRLLTPEDDWICRSGVWVKHGNPNSSMPEELCK